MSVIGVPIIAGASSTKLNSVAAAPAYSASAEYAVGDLVTYKSVLYRCKSAINTAEAWNAAHWEAVDLPELLKVKANATAIATAYSASATYAVGDRVSYNGDFYECNTAIATAEAWNAAHWTKITVDEKLREKYDKSEVYTKEETDALLSTLGNHYGVKWDKARSAMTRTGNAASITTTVTNFAHRGTVNANYNNPFDSIYPWSGCRLCNIDIDAYRALSAGDDIKSCIVAWEGDADFSYDHANGVWKYRPEFWGKSWDSEDGYRYFDITDKDNGSYVHYKPAILGRWRGVKTTLTIDDAEKTVLLPKPGMPCKREAISMIHTYAKNWGATLDSIYSLDGSILMAIIEYANMNMQTALGNGVSELYKEGNDYFTADATDSAVVRVTNADAALVIPGAIFDIGTAKGGVQVGSFYVVSVEVDGTDKVVTLNQPVTVTTANFWSIHGKINVADEEIGSKSGYIGTNGKADCYYRGEVFWGNLWNYVLGAYRQTGTQHVWLAKSDAEADNYDALNTDAHIDTGVTLSSSNGYIKTLGYPTRSGLLSAPAFCTVQGGDSNNPVGDYFYTNASAGNTILIVGGYAGVGANAGPFYWIWTCTASNSYWHYAGRPRLKNP